MLIIMFMLKQNHPPHPFLCITARFLLKLMCCRTLCYHMKPFIALILPFKEDLMQTLKGVAYSKIRKYNLKKKTSKIPLIVYIRLKFLEQVNTIDCK